MNHKNKIIPNVPKDERVSFKLGYHNIPNWLLIVFGVIIFIGLLAIFLLFT